VTQLSTFDDWGNQSFDTIGWNSAVNYTGETTDPGYGLNNYYSRAYDPTTGSWMSQDSWRGLLADPQSLGRYAYVDNGPTTRQDLLGYCYAENSGSYLYGGPCAPKPTPVNSLPSLRVMEIYASEDSPGAHTEDWEPQIYSYDPSGDLQSVPARHVQGYDEDFPGYEPELSYGDSIAENWNETWGGFGDHWNKSWGGVGDRWNDSWEGFVPRWNESWGAVPENWEEAWSHEIGASVFAEGCWYYCLAYVRNANGTNSVQFAMGPQFGFSGGGGFDYGSLNGVNLGAQCTIVAGPVGIYGEGGISGSGTTYRPYGSAGGAGGAELGCSAVVGLTW
jgi:RHS repeat-associated protein